MPIFIFGLNSRSSLKILGLPNEMCNNFNGILKIRWRHVIHTQLKIQISQGKHTISGNIRFVQQIQNSSFNFLVGLKTQSTQCELEGSDICKIFGRKNAWIWTSNQIKNMRRRCDIVFLAEIITYSGNIAPPRHAQILTFSITTMQCFLVNSWQW